MFQHAIFKLTTKQTPYSSFKRQNNIKKIFNKGKKQRFSQKEENGYFERRRRENKEKKMFRKEEKVEEE